MSCTSGRTLPGTSFVSLHTVLPGHISVDSAFVHLAFHLEAHRIFFQSVWITKYTVVRNSINLPDHLVISGLKS